MRDLIVGEKVLNPDGMRGEVTAILSDNRVRVLWDDGTVNVWDDDDPSIRHKMEA